MPYKDPVQQRERNIIYQRAYRAAHREELNAKKRAYHAAHREEYNAYMRAWNAAKDLPKTKPPRLTPEELHARNLAYRRRLREDLIAAYGGRCACCSESTYEFLAIDHIIPVGRRRISEGGHREHSDALMRRLRKEGWPQEGHRLLCHNCNMAYGFYGRCPHQG